MKTWIAFVLAMGAVHAADKPLVLKPKEATNPEIFKPLDPTERVQVCGKNGCSSMPINDLMRQIERERSGGGDIIGNGGGLAEQNFTYALTQLADFINETVKEGLVRGADASNLKLIASGARDEATKADKLVFLSGKNNPGIFDSANDPEIRLAKTGLTQDAPIFVNLDLLYKKYGEETEMLPLTVMVASLVHEIGHNVGLTDHAYLDFLGARVRSLIEREYNRVSKQLTPEVRIEMVSINLGAYSMPRLSLSVGESLVSFDKELYQALRCRDGKAPRAARLGNQHWERPAEFSQRWVAPFRAWATLTCVNNLGQSVSEERDLILDLTIDLSSDKDPGVDVVQMALDN